jgi:outer membrane immunogenic protein
MQMNFRTLFSAVSIGLFSSASMAADLVEIDNSRFDWSGSYIGIVVSKNWGEDWYDGEAYDLNDAWQGGVSLGHNYQMDNFVIGGEISAHFGKITEDGYPDYYFQNFVDLKLRAGYAMDKVLVFGTAGKTFGFGNWDGYDFVSVGYNYGAGVDFAISDNLILGAEFVRRTQANRSGTGGYDFESVVDSVQANIKYKF